MPKQQYKNTINDREDNMAPQEHRQPPVRPEQSKADEGQENDFKSNFMRMVEFFFLKRK